MLVASCASTTSQINTEPKNINKPLLTYGLIFGITVDENRNVKSITLSSVQDPYKKKPVDFVPSTKYLEHAERQLRVRDYGEVEFNKEFFVICGYADVRPDTALCGGEL